MHKRSIFTSWAILFILLFSSADSFSQVKDDINGRLWRLCKVWGFAKYYHQDNCDVNWNDLLLRAIDSTIVTSSNAAFNIVIKELLESAGQISPPTDSLVADTAINLNAHFDWIQDPFFDQDVINILDSIRVNFRPVDNCLVKFNDYTDPNFGGLLSFSNDNILSIPSFSYSVESNRLLAFFYYWNIMNYFHADRNLMDQDWDSTLFQFIPLFREAHSNVDFHIRFLNLVTYLNDSHGFTESQLIADYLGDFCPLLKVQYIENETVVTKVGPNISNVVIGDVVKKIDGVDIAYLLDSLAHFKPASNENSLFRDLHKSLLFGAFSSAIDIDLQDSTGAPYSISLTRKYSSQAFADWAFDDPNPLWEITECGYGYVNMGKLYPNQIPQMYNALKDTPAIIFDVRNYPNNVIWDLIPYLYPHPKTWALFTIPDLTYPGWYNWSDNRLHPGSFTNDDPYDGKVIILVDATTQSHAEYTVMGLQQHPNAYTIGSQTAGADGNVSYITLPGSLYTYWTSMGVYYPDTMTAQRIGVHIDSLVTPTIKGIREGKDEVLAAAFNCLVSSSSEIDKMEDVSLQPNPADDLLYVSFYNGQRHHVEIEAFNILGQQIFQQNIANMESDQFQIDVSTWMDGIYILTLSDDSGIFRTEKIYIQH